MKIHISESTKALLDQNLYKIVERGLLEVKGKGEMKTYFVEAKLDDNGNPIKLPYSDANLDVTEIKKEDLKNAGFQKISTKQDEKISEAFKNDIQLNQHNSAFNTPKNENNKRNNSKDSNEDSLKKIEDEKQKKTPIEKNNINEIAFKKSGNLNKQANLNEKDDKPQSKIIEVKKCSKLENTNIVNEKEKNEEKIETVKKTSNEPIKETFIEPIKESLKENLDKSSRSMTCQIL